MIATNIILGTVVALAISANQNFYQDKLITATESQIRAAAAEVENFDFSNETYESQTNKAKVELYKFMESSNDSYDRSELNTLKTYLIRNDSFFATYYASEYSTYINNSMNLEFITNNAGGGGITIPENSDHTLKKVDGNHQFNGVKTSNNYSGELFFGIYLPKDANIFLYNLLVSFFDSDKLAYKEISQKMAQILKLSLSAYLPTAISIFSAIKNIFAILCPTIALKIIAFIIGCAIIGLLCLAIYFGARKQSFKLGFKYENDKIDFVIGGVNE